MPIVKILENRGFNIRLDQLKSIEEMHSSNENPVSLGELNLLDDNDSDMVAFTKESSQAYDRINTILG